MSDIPERIWRNSPPYPRRSAYHHGLVSWAAKEHADVDATEYVRADIHAALFILLAALAAERDALREALEAIRCNTEPDTLGTICDLPEATSPHSREQHLESQIRYINQHARAALKGQTDE